MRAAAPPPFRALHFSDGALADPAARPRSPNEVIESTRELTDGGRPLEALDGAFMRPLLGEGGARALGDAFSGMSDMMRVAEKMHRAVQELMPGARPTRGAWRGGGGC